MSHERQTLFWLAGLVVFSLLLDLLSPILLPFVAGMAIAYFLDPVADHLEEKGISRGWGTALILFAFFIAAAAILIACWAVPVMDHVVKASPIAASASRSQLGLR